MERVWLLGGGESMGVRRVERVWELGMGVERV